MPEKNNDSVDQIRDILFGEQTKNIEKKFSKLEADINSQFNGIKKQLDALTKQMGASLKNMESQSSEKLNELKVEQTKHVQAVEASINNKIIETEASILSELQEKSNDLDERLLHRKEMSGFLKKMADQISE